MKSENSRSNPAEMAHRGGKDNADCKNNIIRNLRCHPKP